VPIDVSGVDKNTEISVPPQTCAIAIH
jgi:hypothetical protein